MREALWGIPMHQGWQLIHAHLVSEGCGRKWAVAGIGEQSANFTDWRQGNAMQTDWTEDEDEGDGPEL